MKCADCSTGLLEGWRFCPVCGSPKQGQDDDRFILGVDLDGVVADFYKALRPIAAEWRGVATEELPSEVSYGLREWGITRHEYEELHRFAVTQREIFKTQPAIPEAPATLRRLGFHESIRIRIITHRLYIKYTHHASVQQTTDWLEAYGIPYWDICFLKRKGDVGADLYIEDSPPNIAALRRAGKDVLIYTNSTNRGVAGLRASTWDEVESIVLEKVEAWKTRPAEK